MTTTVVAGSALAALATALRQPGTDALAQVMPRLEREHPDRAETFYARAELLRRGGDPRGALAPSATALGLAMGPALARTDGTLPVGKVIEALAAMPTARIGALYAYLEQLGVLMESTGMYEGSIARLEALAAPLLRPAGAVAASAHLPQAAFALLGFRAECSEAWGEAVFERVALPWMQARGAAGDLETPIAIESLAYSLHAKRRESQEWFKRTAGRAMALLAEQAARLRGQPFPPFDRWKPEPVRRIAFFVHNATMLAHIMVLIETLEAVREVGARNYEFTVFVFGGRNAQMRQRLEACGARVRHLDEAGAAGMLARLARMAEALRAENFVACIWTSLVTMMGAAFPLRIAPVQVWWAMKYHAGDVPGIDARLALENVVLRKRLEGHEWLTIGNSSSRWIEPGREAEARALRGRWPADRVVAACVGREEKLDSPAFLASVSALLKRHPGIVFLWTGRSRRASIQEHFEREGVAAQTEFVGWVDTKLYAQAVDLFLDSFPFPCGFSLKEAMAAGKACVMFRSPESLETGVPGSLSPAKAGEDCVAPGVRAALREIFTEREPFDLYLCAETPQEYVELASRAVSDAALRERVGRANRDYIERFVSSPQAEAVKFLDHLDALCAQAPAATA